MSPPTNFFALGRPEPTLTVIHVGFFGVWTAMRAELADYYDEDAELFRIVEASWNADEEYAELVTLNGRIIGALDHALTQDDVAAIWGVNRMEKLALMNRIRSLFNIDGDLLPELTREQQAVFLADPVRFFLNASEAQSDAIMREIQARQTPRAVAHNGAKTGDANVAVKAVRKKKPKRRVDGQREMLLPITGGAAEAPEQVRSPSAGRNAG